MINAMRGNNGSAAIWSSLGFAMGLWTVTQQVATATDKIFERYGFFAGQSDKRKLAAYCLTGCLDVAILHGIRKVPLKSSLLFTAAAIVLPITRHLKLTTSNAPTLRADPEEEPEVSHTPPLQVPNPIRSSVSRDEAINKMIIKAADLGDPEGMYRAALLFENGGAGFEEDLDRSDYYFTKAIARGHVKARVRRVKLYLQGKALSSYQGDLSVDPVKLYFFLRAARQGHPQAMYETGCYCMKGIGMDKNPDKALIYFYVARNHVKEAKKKIDNWPVKVDAELKYDTALALIKSADSSLNFWEIMQLLKSAGSRAYSREERDQGGYSNAAIALNTLGETFYSLAQDNDPKFYFMAFQCFEFSAHIGNAEAAYRLGWAFEHGYGVSADLVTALRHYNIAGKIGSKDANAAYARLVADYGISIKDPLPKIELPESPWESSDEE